MNNPVNLNDPTGHKYNPCKGEASGYKCHRELKRAQDQFDQFFSEAEQIAKNKGKKDTLEAMARIVEKAAKIYSGDWKQMMTALSKVFLGIPDFGVGALQKADQLAESVDGFPTYFLGGYFSDKGFNSAFQDGHNQVYHVWGYIAQTVILSGDYNEYEDAVNVGKLANNYHEFFPDSAGGSRQDFILGVAGMAIGTDISYGKISPYELGGALRTDLGESASTSGQYLFWQYWALPEAQK